MRAVLRDSRRTIKVYVRFADPCKRHGQAEDAEPQQRSAGSCIPTSPGTEARPNHTKRAPCKVVSLLQVRLPGADDEPVKLRSLTLLFDKRPQEAPRGPK